MFKTLGYTHIAAINRIGLTGVRTACYQIGHFTGMAVREIEAINGWLVVSPPMTA
jgi:hypothetical protein